MTLSQAILPNKLTIYQRSKSAVWQARIKLKNGTWHRTTTGKRDINEATERALELYYEVNARAQHNLPQTSRRFSQVAKIAIKQMQDELDSGRGKTIYTHYISALENVLIPFFGRYTITHITANVLTDFEQWRVSEYKKQPAASTITTHNSALNRVFDVALQFGWIAQNAVPKLVNKGKKSDVRPTFSFEEYRRMTTLLRRWAKTGHKERTQMMRELLHDYVLVLANTGMRHGTEALNLKWKDIDWWHDKNGRDYIQMTVNGKTGRRSLIARHNTRYYLQRIIKRFDDLGADTLEEVIERRIDEYVFRLRDKTRSNNLNQAFEAFLKKHELLYGTTHYKPRTLYSLRHLYATFELWRGRNIHQLAIQMGTSVGMLEQHYSKLTPQLLAEQFGGYRWEEQDDKS